MEGQHRETDEITDQTFDWSRSTADGGDKTVNTRTLTIVVVA